MKFYACFIFLLQSESYSLLDCFRTRMQSHQPLISVLFPRHCNLIVATHFLPLLKVYLAAQLPFIHWTVPDPGPLWLPAAGAVNQRKGPSWSSCEDRISLPWEKKKSRHLFRNMKWGKSCLSSTCSSPLHPHLLCASGGWGAQKPSGPLLGLARGGHHQEVGGESEVEGALPPAPLPARTGCIPVQLLSNRQFPKANLPNFCNHFLPSCLQA